MPVKEDQFSNVKYNQILLMIIDSQSKMLGFQQQHEKIKSKISAKIFSQKKILEKIEQSQK